MNLEIHNLCDGNVGVFWQAVQGIGEIQLTTLASRQRHSLAAVVGQRFVARSEEGQEVSNYVMLPGASRQYFFISNGTANFDGADEF